MPACAAFAFAGIHTIPPETAVVPPTNADFSMSTTRRPSAAATHAAVIPPAPAPRTTTSYSLEIVIGYLVMGLGLGDTGSVVAPK
jgi:hypothetical protein